jgi:hypothetical protein
MFDFASEDRIVQYTDLQQHAIWLLKLHGFCLNNLPRLPPSWQGWNPDLLVWVVMPPKMILSYPLAGPAVALCCGGDLLMSKVQPIVRGILRRQRQVFLLFLRWRVGLVSRRKAASPSLVKIAPAVA